MVPSLTRMVAKLLPAGLYHWLVVRAARLPLVPTQSFRHSVVFRHPLHPRTKHYVLVPTEYSPSVLDLPAPAAQRLQEDILQWITTSDWRFVTVVANFGAYQESPFLHIHLFRSSMPPADGAESTPEWLTVEVEDGEVQSGRRVISYDSLQGAAEVTTEVNRS